MHKKPRLPLGSEFEGDIVFPHTHTVLCYLNFCYHVQVILLNCPKVKKHIHFPGDKREHSTQ